VKNRGKYDNVGIWERVGELRTVRAAPEGKGRRIKVTELGRGKERD